MAPTGTAGALTDEGEGTLSFDLSAYAGQTVTLRFLYSTDTAVQWDGWWVDDISLDDASGSVFTDDVEGGAGAWVADHFRIVPSTEIFPRYYLVEWRNYSGFDRGLMYAYQTVWSDDDEWEVDRVPYHVPGAVVWIRDGSYGFDYTLSDSYYDDPSWGPKHALLVVDSHPFPLTWDDHQYSTGAGVRLGGRAQSRNAAFTLDDPTTFTLRLGYDPATGEYTTTIQETKVFSADLAVSAFHDSMGYYPGFYFTGDGYVYWRDIDASAVVPAMDNYSTKITDLGGNPFYGLYGIDIGGTVLGSGNPGDNNVQYGLNIEVLDQAPDGSWGEIAVYNQMVDISASGTAGVVMKNAGAYTATYQTVLDNKGGAVTSNVAVTFTLGEGLSPVKLTEANDVGTVRLPPMPRAGLNAIAQAEMSWWNDGLGAGQTITLTLVATGTVDLPLEADTLSVQVDVFDGAAARGPWMVETALQVPTVSFVTPTDGQVFMDITTTTVPIEIATTDFVIPTDGHWHLWVDGALVGPVMTYTTSTDLALGMHVISAALHLPDHTALGIEAAVVVTVEPYSLFLPVVFRAHEGTIVLP